MLWKQVPDCYVAFVQHCERELDLLNVMYFERGLSPRDPAKEWKGLVPFGGDFKGQMRLTGYVAWDDTHCIVRCCLLTMTADRPCTYLRDSENREVTLTRFDDAYFGYPI